MYFTNSPYERMMTHIPHGKREPETVSLPTGHPCRGCGYCKGENCVGICWRNFFEGKEKRQDL
jgi:hypothetical protein